ncbi:Omp28-related outer membrane protein, partial [Lishizhenia sp.]|uniref:Omp28-related outer membrane protein n=1 Tax=Lishizhenia sp. TaxID=2497594 RepID=UPI00299F4FBC
MKKLLPLMSGVLASSLTFGQTFSDDFESYAAGTQIGTTADWTTWSGSGGGSDDVAVSSTLAHSGTNALYFLATGSGGPGDIVKDFGGEYSTGNFDFEVWMYVANGKKAYFNFQKESTIGNAWAMDANFSNGTLQVYNTDETFLTTSYTEGTWFKFSMQLNLNTNNWEVFIDNNNVGSFSNSINQIASLNIYSIQGAEFYLDDIAYTITPYTLPSTNAGLTYLDPKSVLVGQSNSPEIRIRNLGVNTINSVEVTLDYNGNQTTETFTNLNLASLDEVELSLSNSITLSSGAANFTATITNVNGNGLDDDSNDDSQSQSLTPIEVYPGRMVFGEEATGTWCGWCPRGAVAMDEMEIEFHDFWAGVAVHNNDPMANATYDAALGAYINGYPSGIVDRGADIDPSAMRQDFIQRITTQPSALIEMGAEFNATTRELKMSLSAEIIEAINNNYKLAIILTEDSVTGTTSGYNQANYYGSQGITLIDPAGYNWGDLPSSVPASQMIYNHVGRGIYPSFGGMVNSLPATVAVGETHTINASIILDQDWDETKMNLIGILIDPSGDVNNAGKASLSEAIDNGYVLTTDNFDFNYVNNLFEIYP